MTSKATKYLTDLSGKVLDVKNKVQALFEPDHRWITAGERVIREWFDRSDYTRVAHIRGGDADRMIDNCIRAFCAMGTFNFYDKMVKFLLTFQGWESLTDKTGLHFGCDWGFTSLHVAQRWQPAKLVAVDLTGKYAYAAREVRSECPQIEEFQRVELVEAGPWGMTRYRESAEFAIVTKSFGLLDDYVNRKELYKVVSTLKVGGALIYFPPKRPGLIDFADYLPLLAACGCDDVKFLRGNGRDVGLDEPDAIYFIIARKTRTVANNAFDAELTRFGQDPTTLAARRPELDHPHDTIVQRIAAVHEQVSAGQTRLKTLPLRYTLNVISVCNIKCIFCDYPDRLRHWTVPETFLTDIMQTLDGTLRVQITGGEPLLNKVAVDVISRSGDVPYTQLELISNLTTEPKREIVEKVARGVSFITCSIDAATKPTYDQIRQESNWEHVLGNLRLLRQIREERGTNYPHIQINFIIMGHNFQEIAEFMNLARDLQVDSVAYKWLLWTLTPRITEAARFDFKDDAKVLGLIEQIKLACERSRQYGISIVWGPVPHHIQSERPDLYAREKLDEVFAPANVAPFTNPKSIFSAGPRQGTTSPMNAAQLDDAVKHLDEMPDGLMPCLAPFASMQVNGPQHANFCCYSTPEYRAIEIDSSGSLLDAWNSPKFVEAREHFLAGKYDKVCRPHCSLYREYERRKEQQANGVAPVRRKVEVLDDAWQVLENENPNQKAVLPIVTLETTKK